MDMKPLSPPSARPTLVELFTPKITTVLREGYGSGQPSCQLAGRTDRRN